MNINRKALWGRLLLLVLVVAGLGYATVRYAAPLTRLISDTSRFSDYLQSFGGWGELVFVSIQALQVVISPIPGELTQLAGGFIYGTLWGVVYSVAGILLGATIAFFIGRLFGFPLLKIILPARALQKFRFVINNPKAELTMLMLFLIPGIPKDVLTYIAGLTPVRPVRFLLTAMVARFPGILLSSFIGAHVEEQKFVQVFIASGVAVGLFIAGVLWRDRMIQALHPKRPKSAGNNTSPDVTDKGGMV
jgi:uncharacterized membrane protein YdjX (TVP38/TMEM64 family)